MTQIIIVFILIFLNAIFAAAEVAVIACDDLKVESDANDGNKRAKRIFKFIKNPTNFLSSIQIGITLIGFLNGYLVADKFSLPLVEFFQRFFDVQTAVLQPIMTFIVTLILAYFQVVLGELVPKRIAMKHPEKIAYGTSLILVIISSVMRPFVWLLQVSADTVGRLFKIDPNASNDNDITEEEIRRLVVTGGLRGAIAKGESEMIENVLDFDDIRVEDLMKHRTEIIAIDYDSSKEEVLKIAKEERYTRFPVYLEDIDHIVGILNSKDLLKFMDSDDSKFDLKGLMREPFFTTKTMKVSKLLNEMKKQQTHLAVVIDEYGGTAGIITLEDLIEEIVGDILDEYDDIEEDVKIVNENVYLVKGLSEIEDVEDVINAGLPIDDHDTISGFILAEIGRFPHKGEQIEFIYNDFKFEVLNFTETVIQTVKITRLEDKEEEQKI